MQCAFRLANEGLETIGNVIGDDRRVEITRGDMISLLEHTNPKNPPELETLSEFTKKRMEQMESGSCLLQYRDAEITFQVVGWKGVKSLRAYLDLNDSIHLLRLLGADVSRFEVNKFVTKSDQDAMDIQNETAADVRNEN